MTTKEDRALDDALFEYLCQPTNWEVLHRIMSRQVLRPSVVLMTEADHNDLVAWAAAPCDPGDEK